MPDISFIFEVHQPFRINRRFYQELLGSERTRTEDLFDLYFDSKLNKDIFTRISEQCYLPANNAILNSIDKQKREKRPFKVAYSISGSFIEQCEKWNKDILESFKQLSESRCVEFLEQTYYHSIVSLSENEGLEFIEQVRMHQQLMRDLLNCKPTIFENTECLYNNRIGRIVSDLGYKAILTEGSERILGWRSPNFLYKSRYSNIHILLRNYLLSDDVGFRFSSRDWK